MIYTACLEARTEILEMEIWRVGEILEKYGELAESLEAGRMGSLDEKPYQASETVSGGEV